MKVVPALISLLLAASACGDDGNTPQPALFPADYLTTYTEVRNCRFSADHDLRYIRILTNSIAHDAYVNRDAPFPTDSIIVKEERDGDSTCTSPDIASFSVAKKLPEGSSPKTLDWAWQRVDPATMLDVTEDVTRCYGCHAGCPSETYPDGYLYTCATPP